MLSKSSPLLCLETSLNVHILHSLSLLTEIHEASTTRLAPLAYQNLLSYVFLYTVVCMENIRGRFSTYSESFPEDIINLKDELQNIETEVESTFMNDLKKIKKIINDKKIRINIKYNKFKDKTYLFNQVLYADTKIPHSMIDMLRFYIANLFICRDALQSLISYISRVIRNVQNSNASYRERKSNRLIKDFHEFIGCCTDGLLSRL